MSLLARLSLAHRGLVALVALVVTGFGAIAIPSLKQQLLPSLEFPAAFISAGYPGAAPEIVEAQVVEPIEGFELWQRFQVEGYLEYHGAKLARRFDANSYLLLTKAMDLHDLGRGRGGEASALARITVPTLVIGVDSDTLYPTYQQRAIVDALARARYVEITSPHGHDAFLLDAPRVGAILAEALTAAEPAVAAEVGA